MNRMIDEKYHVYGPWIVVARHKLNYHPKTCSMVRWICVCRHCGAKKIYIGNGLRFGHYAHTCRECGGS